MNTRVRIMTCLALALAITFTLGTSTAITATACDPTFVIQQANVFTVLPTGTDDTVNLQCAFDAAVAAGPGANVRLVAGAYHTAQIVVFDFYGHFSGAGANETTIYNLPHLYVVADFLNPPSAENPWPELFYFFDGDFSISNLAIRIIGEEPVQEWSISGMSLNELAAAILISGTEAYAEIDHVLIEGEIKPASLLGYNLLNGIMYEGWAEWLGNPPISGSYRLTDSTFLTVGWASPIINLANASVVISRNNYKNTFIATDGGDFVSSTIEYSHNDIDGGLMGLEFWNGDPSTDTDSTFLVKNNRFRTDLAGIALEQTLGEGNDCLILGNNVQQVGEYGVYLGEGIHHCTVVGGSNKTNVLDLGTDNILVGVNNMGTGVGHTIGGILRVR